MNYYAENHEALVFSPGNGHRDGRATARMSSATWCSHPLHDVDDTQEAHSGNESTISVEHSGVAEAPRGDLFGVVNSIGNLPSLGHSLTRIMHVHYHNDVGIREIHK